MSPDPSSPPLPIRSLGLLGDVHAQHKQLGAALKVLAPTVDAIACTGDLADGSGDLMRCCELLNDHQVHCVRGNHDRWLLTDRVRDVSHAHRRAHLDATTVEYLETLPLTDSFTTVRGEALLCHGVACNDLAKVWPGSERADPERSKDLDQLIVEGAPSFLLNGHMHYRYLVHFRALTMINAGTLLGRHRPGFTRIDFATENIQVWEFDSLGRPKPVGEHPLFPDDRRVWQDTQCFDGRWKPVTLYGAG